MHLIPSGAEVRRYDLGVHRPEGRNHQAIVLGEKQRLNRGHTLLTFSSYGQKMLVGMVERPDGALANELGIKDLSHEHVGSLLHVQPGSDLNVG